MDYSHPFSSSENLDIFHFNNILFRDISYGEILTSFPHYSILAFDVSFFLSQK